MNNKLIVPDFKPKTDIEEYTSKKRASDGLALNYLTEDWFWKKIFQPLAFFNLLYEQTGIVVANRSNPILLKKHLRGLKLTKAQLLYLFKFIGDHLDNKIATNKLVKDPLDFENIGMLQDCKELLEMEYRLLFTELYENEKKEIDNPNNRFDYAREMKVLEKLPDDEAKYTYLQNLLTEYQKNEYSWESKKRWNGESFDGIFTKERDRYKVLIDNQNSPPTETIKIESNRKEDKSELNRTEELIISKLSGMDKNEGWKYSFRTESDLKSFVRLISDYFEGEQYTPTVKAIQLRRGCITCNRCDLI